MDWYRLKHTLGMMFTLSATGRAEYLKKRDILRHVGKDCMVMFRKMPLYPKLISLGDNVWIASNVSFVTHDVIHEMLNRRNPRASFRENIGCIEIKDNCFIGANTTILPDVSIGPNAIVGAGSLVNKSISGGVYGGVPARYICSLEEYVDRRKERKELKVERSAEELSGSTVEAAWKRFEESARERNDL